MLFVSPLKIEMRSTNLPNAHGQEQHKSAIYSIGVRGPMWKIIQGRLDGASACTTWNAAHGPSSRLAEGPKEGSALSPIPQCAFINLPFAQ